MIGPSLEELSEELGEQVSIVKLNIDDNPEAPGNYGVRGIPTMILFKAGAPAATKVGAEPKGRIKAWLEGALATKPQRREAGRMAHCAAVISFDNRR